MAKGTVLVNLRRDWFGPDGSLYQVRDNPHEFPASFADAPEQVEDESDEDFKARKKKQPFAVLPSTAEVLGDEGKTAVVLQQTGSGDFVKTAGGVPDDVKSVGGALDSKGVEQPSQSAAAADKAADAANLQVGGKPRESGPLPAGTKSTK